MRALNPQTFLADTLRPYATQQKSGKPDLLERYLLDPGDDDDRAIEVRLDAVNAIWLRSFEHPRYGVLCKALAGEHEDAGFALLDAGERARLAQEARAGREAADRAAAVALAEWRTLLAENVEQQGGLTPHGRAQLERLAKQRGLDPDAVATELDAAPVARAPELLEPRVREQIRRLLADLARDVGEERLALSLYHAIGLAGITEDVTAVRRMYDEALARTNRQAIGQTATTYKTVLSNVKLHLLDSDPRAYIASLSEDVAEAMAFEGAQAATDGHIDATEAEALLQSTLRRGLTPELGRRVIAELAKQNGATVEVSAPVDYVGCPSCNTPHPRPSAPARCRRCATDLFVTCPAQGCGVQNDATVLRCAACGSDLHRFAEATRRLHRLGEAAGDGRVAWAVAEIGEIANVLGDQAVPADLRERVERRLGEAETRWKSVETAIAERRLYAARTALRSLAKEAVDVLGATGDTPAVRLGEVEARLGDVDAALERARAASGREREAALVEAIGLAADCEEAERALAAIPPDPPMQLSARFDGVGVALSWRASTTAGAEYVVSRTDARTGVVEEVAVTAATRHTDHQATSGAAVRYEVRTRRGAAESAPAASEAVLVARELQDVEVSDLDGEVRIAWRPAPATAKVLVERSADGEGTVALPADRSGLVDGDVRNGERYAYRLVTEYATPRGEVARTAGVTVYGQPVAPPEPIDGLRIVEGVGGVTLEFERPSSGAVTVVRCDQEPALGHGDWVDPGQLGRYGTVLAKGAGVVRDASPGHVCWYVPVTVAGSAGVVGRPARHLGLGAVQGVRAVQTAAQVTVTWEWPADLRIAQVLWRRDRQPNGPDEPGVHSAWVRLGEYKDHAGFTIEAPGSEPVFVAVVPGIRADGELIAGTAIGKGARAAVRPVAKTDLRYVVKRSGMRKRRLDVAVEVPAGVPAPNLVLVARAGDLLPRRAEDGDVVLRLGGNEPLSSSIDLSQRKRPMAVRLFLEASSSASSFRLFDPAADDLLIR